MSRVFIASSSDLHEERRDLKILLYDEKLEPILWEDIDHSITEEKFQDRINSQHLTRSDIVIFMIKSRLGQYTAEELDFTFSSLNSMIKKVYIYFFDIDKNKIDNNELLKILSLQKKLKERGDLYQEVNSFNDLNIHLSKQIRRHILPNLESFSIVENTMLKEKENEIEIYLTKHMKIPKRDENFIGRESEIREILLRLEKRETLAITTNIVAGGGYGKSALATEIVHQIKDSWRGFSTYLIKKLFTDGILWLKMELDQTLESIIEEQIAKQLGVKLTIDEYQSELETLLFEKNILIVIDSAEQNERNSKSLIDILRDFPIMMTSREPFSGVYQIRIWAFEREKSIELFETHLNKELAREEKEEIGDFCIEVLGGLPLTITIVANYMKMYEGTTIPEIRENIDILTLSMDGVRTDAVFELSYQKLSSKAQKVFAIGSIYKYPFEREHLLEIIKKDNKTKSIFQEINELIKHNLLEVDNGLYSYHPLLREYSWRKLATFENSEEIIEAKKEFTVSLAEKEEFLEKIYKELLSVIDEDYNDSNYNRYFKGVSRLDWWLVKKGLYNTRERLLTAAIRKAKEIGNEKYEYVFLISYIHHLIVTERYEKAKEKAKDALEIPRENIDFYLHYLIYGIEYHLYDYEYSYKKNLEYSREALYHHKIDKYASFYKTNSWVSNSNYKLNFSIEYAIINNFMPDTRGNKFKSLIDLIKTVFYQKNYQEVIEYAYVIENYFNDKGLDIADKVEVLRLKIWAYLYVNHKNFLEEIIKIERTYQLLSLGSSEHDSIHKVKMLYYIKVQDFKKAESVINLIIDKRRKKICLGIFNSYINIGKSQDIFKRLLSDEQHSTKDKAELKLYLAKVYALNNQLEDSVKCLVEVQEILQEYMTPIEEEVFFETLNILGKESFEKIQSSLQINIIVETFFLDKNILPSSIINTRDNKKMILIPQGFSIFGVDNFDIPLINEIFINPEKVLNNSKEYQNIRYLCNFYIDEFPVTVGEYIQYCDESDKDFEHFEHLLSLDENSSIQNLTIKEMQEYAKFYHKVLPLPEEWEKAYRGEKNLNYPWGNEWDDSVPIEIDEEKFLKLKNLFVSHETFGEYFEWFKERRTHYNNINENIQEHTQTVQTLFLHDTFESYYKWYTEYTLGSIDDLELLEKLNLEFDEEVVVDKFYFFKLALNSLSLDVEDTLKVFRAIPELDQNQVTSLIDVFTEEIHQFYKLSENHPNDVYSLYSQIKENAIEVIFKLQNEETINVELFKLDNELNEEDMGVLNHIEFDEDIIVDKYYFFKLLFYSLSLNTLEKFRVIDAIPTLSQFQVDELVRVFEEEVNKFDELNQEHPEDIIKLFERIQEQALDIIGELTLKKSQYIKTKSPYGVLDMVGNGYEVTLKEDTIFYKGSILTHDYKEKFKGKTSWIEEFNEDRKKRVLVETKYPRTTFRCVKPIFSIEDLKDVQKPFVAQIEYKED